jgi:hypothetical protein
MQLKTFIYCASTRHVSATVGHHQRYYQTCVIVILLFIFNVDIMYGIYTIYIYIYLVSYNT